jgi:hypothetical protein
MAIDEHLVVVEFLVKSNNYNLGECWAPLIVFQRLLDAN